MEILSLLTDGASMQNNDSHAFYHFKRPRITQLFTEAIKYPLVVVCAGAGYGKTTAVHDFAEEYKATTLWLQLSERDNVGARFWENFSNAMAQDNRSFAKAISKLGFPDNPDKLNQFITLIHELAELKRRMIVLDDCHFIEDLAMVHFMERIISKMPVGTSLFLISRITPNINTAGLVSRGQIFNINENHLRFTETELSQYFRHLDIDILPDSQREIMKDTKGWAFAINLIARSYQKAPGYRGYLRSAMKSNIFNLLKTEIWDQISKKLQNFLIRISLIDHLSVDLISLLAGEDKSLIQTMEKQNAYVRKDIYINAYLIHPLFMEFLSTKQELLTDKQKCETYIIAGDWCSRNGFKIDALSYYEKTGDYKSIVSIFRELPAQIPVDIAKYTATILDNAPKKAFDTVEFLVILHIRCYLCQGLWEKSMELADFYEKKFAKLPAGNSFRNLTLGGINFCRAYLRGVLCLNDDKYDFDVYFGKIAQYLSNTADLEKYTNHSLGAWIIVVGSSRKGAPLDYIGALNRASSHLSRCNGKLVIGQEELARGELAFYQGNLDTAEVLFTSALAIAKENRQFEIEQRSLLYIMRLGFAQGDFTKAEQTLKSLSSQLRENEYTSRFIRYDVSQSWYYHFLGMHEKIPDWLKENFSPYSHASFIENFANQIKARYLYSKKRFSLILSYIREMELRESFLFGKLEMLAMEACIYYKMKDKKKALATLNNAYTISCPNEIIMPFIELGKDMRTLSAAALKEKDNTIPDTWLKTINRKASTYAKHLAHTVAEYKQTNRIADGIVLSNREAEILKDLSQGLSRIEIATSRGLSINTVKMLIRNIHSKTGSQNMADLIRIAVLQKLI